MLGLREKQQLRRIVFSKVSLILLLVVAVIFARGTWGVYQKASYAKENRQRAELELADLHERKQTLEGEIERLGTDRGLEEEIRQKFDVGHAGEELVVLLDAPEPETGREPQSQTLWQRTKNFFGF